MKEKSLERASPSTAKSEEKTKKLVSQKFYKQIYIFGKKASEKMPTKKLWDHAIGVKVSICAKKEKDISYCNLSQRVRQKRNLVQSLYKRTQ